MKYSSTKTFPSETCGGVTFTLRRMTKRRRDLLEENQAPAREKMKPLLEEYLPLDQERVEAAKEKKGDFPVEKLQRWWELHRAIRKIEDDEMETEAVRFVLVRIEGLELLDDSDSPVETSLDNLLMLGPDELYQEIAKEVKRELGLLEEEKKLSGSPSTSSAPEVPADGNAGNAGKKETITSAAA